MRKFSVQINDSRYEVGVEEITNAPAVEAASKAAAAPAAKPANQGETLVQSPMPGTILQVSVNVGDKVKTRQQLLILEAMKMENEILASVDGTVTGISVRVGATVSTGELLLTIG